MMRREKMMRWWRWTREKQQLNVISLAKQCEDERNLIISHRKKIIQKKFRFQSEDDSHLKSVNVRSWLKAVCERVFSGCNQCELWKSFWVIPVRPIEHQFRMFGSVITDRMVLEWILWKAKWVKKRTKECNLIVLLKRKQEEEVGASY